mmetsp:Transcript_23696/g.74169  ORF Transcript_23696/g.74169 Transcript_23696/m.74169 type:complete len:214 (+) Transcript_23696:6795-7436(+)
MRLLGHDRFDHISLVLRFLFLILIIFVVSVVGNAFGLAAIRSGCTVFFTRFLAAFLCRRVCHSGGLACFRNKGLQWVRPSCGCIQGAHRNRRVYSVGAKPLKDPVHIYSRLRVIVDHKRDLCSSCVEYNSDTGPLAPEKTTIWREAVAHLLARDPKFAVGMEAERTAVAVRSPKTRVNTWTQRLRTFGDDPDAIGCPSRSWHVAPTNRPTMRS